jgi:hypothetical protein
MLKTLFLMHLMLSVAVYGLFCLEKGHLLFIMAYIYKNRQANWLACSCEYINIYFILCFGRGSTGRLRESALHASALRQPPY